MTEAGMVVIGGSDAGTMAGLWARQVAGDLPLTLVVRDVYPNFSICGIPFYVSGETPDWRMLAHRSHADLEAAGLRLLLGHEAVAIDPRRRSVTVQPGEGAAFELAYDSLVIGTGATPIRPELPGVGLPGVHLLHTIDDARELRRVVDDGARRVVLPNRTARRRSGRSRLRPCQRHGRCRRPQELLPRRYHRARSTHR